MFSIRINTVRTTVSDCLAQLHELYPHAKFQPNPWIAEGFSVVGISKEDMVASPLNVRGEVYIQNLSSMLPAIVLDPHPGERVLDMCAAPGSKTTHLAAVMKNQGEIIANDASRTRMFKLKSQLERYGITNTKIRSEKGEFLWRKFTNDFDRVLLDAPCSMDQEMSGKKVKLLSQQQKYLLRSALACCKEGGRIVYSTCTSRGEENEEVVAWLLQKEEKVRSIPIDIEGLPERFVTSEGFVRIEKDEQYDPFFVACLVKG